MVELKVISHVSKQLNGYLSHPFKLWNEADPVFNHVIGIDQNTCLAYLKAERKKFFESLMSLPAYEFPIAVESTLDQLRRYWTDANEFYDVNDNGVGAGPVAWSLIKTYKTETFHYICDLYYYIIIRPELDKVDIYDEIPGLNKEHVHDYFKRTGILSERRLNQYEQQQKHAPAPDTQPGRAMTTRKNDASVNLDSTIEKVCNLLNGTLVKYDNSKIHWVFKGNAALYAYFALKLKLSAGDTAIRWEYLKDQVIFDTFDAQYNVLKKNASQFAKILNNNETQGLPQGHEIIDKAFK